MRGRLVLLVVVVAVGVGMTATASRRPAAAASEALQARQTLPLTGAAAVPVCPGPETLLAPAGGQTVPAGGPVTVTGMADGAAVTVGGQAVPLGPDGVGVVTQPRGAAGPVAMRPAPGADGDPPRSLVQLDLSRHGDLRGLTAVACPIAADRTWLVGGGTQPGRRERLILTDPELTPAVVDVTVHGPQGVVAAPAGAGVVVPPGQQVALLLDALAPDLDALAVEVQVRSGRVAAVLNDTWVRGVTPGGTDDVTAAAPATHTQYVPGVSIAPAADGLPPSATAPGAVAVRVVDPGPDAAVVQVQLLGPAGPVTPPDAVVTVAPGAVQDVPITGVPAGEYTAVVDSDSPVLAGAVVGRTVPGGADAGTPAALGRQVPPSEFAWAPSVEPLRAPVVVAVPSVPENGGGTSPGATLAVTAPGGAADVVVTQFDQAAHRLRTSTITVASASTAEVVLSDDVAGVSLRPGRGSAPVVAALVLEASDVAGPMLSVVPVRPGPDGGGARPLVQVDPRAGLGG